MTEHRQLQPQRERIVVTALLSAEAIGVISLIGLLAPLLITLGG